MSDTEWHDMRGTPVTHKLGPLQFRIINNNQENDQQIKQ